MPTFYVYIMRNRFLLSKSCTSCIVHDYCDAGKKKQNKSLKKLNIWELISKICTDSCPYALSIFVIFISKSSNTPGVNSVLNRSEGQHRLTTYESMTCYRPFQMELGSGVGEKELSLFCAMNIVYGFCMGFLRKCYGIKMISPHVYHN